MSDEESKIVVDEDFKAQVEREREVQRAAEEEAKAAGGEEGAGPGGQEIPEASMQFLISMLSSQVMMAMGFLPTPDGQQPPVDLPLAKHFIDLLAVLDEKTKGNLTEEEQSMMTESLHQFRMAYVQYTQGGPEAGDDQQPEAPASTIELP
jgi:hypothetical protein